MKNDNYILVFSTAPNKKEALKISKKLIKSSLAACVNIFRNERSVYRWKGKIYEESEYQLIIKSKKKLFKKLKSAIKKAHSYETPEIVAVDIKDADGAYLRWIDESVL